METVTDQQCDACRASFAEWRAAWREYAASWVPGVTELPRRYQDALPDLHAALVHCGMPRYPFPKD